MKRVAVIAHRGKTLGGGLPELRRVLAERGVTDVFWREVAKSRFAPKQVKKALAHKADLIFVWGGDGMVQRCIDVVAGTDATRGDHPGRHREPARDATSASRRTSSRRSTSASAATHAASTSAASTASASPSWRAPASTRA